MPLKISKRNTAQDTITYDAIPKDLELAIPQDHPFLIYDVVRTNQNVVVYIGFRNLLIRQAKDPDGTVFDTSLYDLFGPSTAMGLLPEAFFSPAVFDPAKGLKGYLDQLVFSLTVHFLSDIVNRKTIIQRDRAVLYKDRAVYWDHVTTYFACLLYKLRFLKSMVRYDQGEFQLLLAPNGTWSEYQILTTVDAVSGEETIKVLPTKECEPMATAKLPLNMKAVTEEMQAFEDHLLEQGDPPEQVADAVNQVLKGYLVGQLAHWCLRINTTTTTVDQLTVDPPGLLLPGRIEKAKSQALIGNLTKSLAQDQLSQALNKQVQALQQHQPDPPEA